MKAETLLLLNVLCVNEEALVRKFNALSKQFSSLMAHISDGDDRAATLSSSEASVIATLMSLNHLIVEPELQRIWDIGKLQRIPPCV